MASRRYELGVGCLLLGAAAVVAFMALQVGALAGLGSTVDVTARFHDAAGLQVGAAASIAGVSVGRVSSMTIDHDVAVVELALDPSLGIGKDSKVRIRARSLLGEKYIEVIPGARGVPALVDGDVVIVADEQLEIDELISRMGPFVDAIQPDQLAKLIGAMSKALDDDPERVSRMLANADTMLANGATASGRLDGLMTEGQQTLSSARGTLSKLDRAAGQGSALLGKADGVLDDVAVTTDKLPALVDELDATLGDGRHLIAEFEQRNDQLKLVLTNFEGFDEVEMRRLLREEGILVRLRPREVDPDPKPGYKPRGKTK